VQNSNVTINAADVVKRCAAEALQAMRRELYRSERDGRRFVAMVGADGARLGYHLNIRGGAFPVPPVLLGHEGTAVLEGVDAAWLQQAMLPSYAEPSGLGLAEQVLKRLGPRPEGMSTAVAVFAPYDEAEKHAEDSTLGWHKSAERVAVARDRDAALAASISVDINTGKYTLIFKICFGCVWASDPAFRCE
jgi:hypothetical protein